MSVERKIHQASEIEIFVNKSNTITIRDLNDGDCIIAINLRDISLVCKWLKECLIEIKESERLQNG